MNWDMIIFVLIGLTIGNLVFFAGYKIGYDRGVKRHLYDALEGR